MVRSNALVTVPVNPNFSSINLAQSVLLMSYEWFLATQVHTDKSKQKSQTEAASIIEIEKLAQHYEIELEKKSYFFPIDKAS